MDVLPVDIPCRGGANCGVKDRPSEGGDQVRKQENHSSLRLGGAGRGGGR